MRASRAVYDREGTVATVGLVRKGSPVGSWGGSSSIPVSGKVPARVRLVGSALVGPAGSGARVDGDSVLRGGRGNGERHHDR